MPQQISGLRLLSYSLSPLVHPDDGQLAGSPGHRAMRIHLRQALAVHARRVLVSALVLHVNYYVRDGLG